MIGKILNALLGKRPERNEEADLYAKLMNIQMFFDIRELETEQIVNLLGNSAKLLDACLVELQSRGVDTDILLDRLKEQSRNDPDADKLI